MTAIDEPCLLSGLNGHRRPFAIGTIEDESLARCSSQLVECAAWCELLFEIRIGSVDRAGNHPVTLTLGAVAEVDEDDARLAEEFAGFRAARRPSARLDDFLHERPEERRGG